VADGPQDACMRRANAAVHFARTAGIISASSGRRVKLGGCVTQLRALLQGCLSHDAEYWREEFKADAATNLSRRPRLQHTSETTLLTAAHEI